MRVDHPVVGVRLTGALCVSGDNRRPQQAAVSPLQDDAGDLRPGETHRGSEERFEGQGGSSEGGSDQAGVPRSQT